MKKGYVGQSTETVTPGFSINREGCSLYIQFIDDTVTEKELHNEVDDGQGNITMEPYTTNEYTYYYDTCIITTYEELINHMITLKYTVEDELALINNLMANPNNRAEYDDYRKYVTLCKSVAKERYESLGLSRD